MFHKDWINDLHVKIIGLDNQKVEKYLQVNKSDYKNLV